MRVSTRGRYGLRAMYELARSFGMGPVPMRAVAKRQELSRKHLHALLTTLRTAGLVHSVRGAAGGFVLAKPPAEIRLGEILKALEGPCEVVHCVTDARTCRRAKHCVARPVWQELKSAIDRLLEDTTLEDLASSGGGRSDWRGTSCGERKAKKNRGLRADSAGGARAERRPRAQGKLTQRRVRDRIGERQRNRRAGRRSASAER